MILREFNPVVVYVVSFTETPVVGARLLRDETPAFRRPDGYTNPLKTFTLLHGNLSKENQAMKKLGISLLCLTLVSAASHAASAFSDADDAVKYRKSAFQMIRHNTADIGDMLQGKVPMDAARLQKRTAALVALTQLPWDGFLVEGANKASGDAKAEIWQDFADFSKRAEQFQQDAKTLQQAATSGDNAALKKAFMAFRGNCKACHEQYKAD